MESIVIIMPGVKDDVQIPRAQISEDLRLNYGCQMSDILNVEYIILPSDHAQFVDSESVIAQCWAQAD